MWDPAARLRAVESAAAPSSLCNSLRNLHHGTLTRPVSAAVVTASGNHVLPLTVWVLDVASSVAYRLWSY